LNLFIVVCIRIIAVLGNATSIIDAMCSVLNLQGFSFDFVAVAERACVVCFEEFEEFHIKRLHSLGGMI
jgi:hypothetical protein